MWEVDLVSIYLIYAIDFVLLLVIGVLAFLLYASWRERKYLNNEENKNLK